MGEMQRICGTVLWRLAATTLPIPPALATGGAAAFWNPAQPAGPEHGSVAFEAIETSPEVGAQGVLLTARARVTPIGGVGLVYGRMSIGDLVRTSLSPDPDPGGIPYYTQTIGVNWSTTAAATTVGATLAYQDTQLDATRADRWTLDVGASRAISDWARVAAATHFFSRFAANDPAQDLYAGADFVVVREGSYGDAGWRPVAGMRVTVGRYRLSFARDAALNDVGAAYRVGRDALAQWLAARGEPDNRAKQIVPRLWQRPAASWDDASDLPTGLRRALAEAFPLRRLELTARQLSRDGTEKYLWSLGAGEAIESVLIPEGRRRTLCISSQEGCALGCVFCATGRMGFRQNLSAAEITGQVRELMLLDPSLKPTNVVFMGMGEPLLNWDAVDTALTILNHPDGLGIGARHVTVSTVGILPNLARLARRPEQFRLALSLHAPTAERRRELMPIEKKYGLPDVMKALQQFRRRVTLEYVLIDGKNDALEDADRLAKLARPLGALVNLLPLHPGGAPDLTPSARAQMLAFERRLKARGVVAVLRRSRGLDISAACGQLRVELEARRREVRPEEHARVE